MENRNLSNKHSALIMKTEASWRSLLRLRQGRGGVAVVLPEKNVPERRKVWEKRETGSARAGEE